MAVYKVIYRNDNPKWQDGCPIWIEAIQVARDTQSAKTFLQLKVRNVSGINVGAIAIEATVESPSGDTQTVCVSSLDADISPNQEFSPTAEPLSLTEVKSIEAHLTRVDDITNFNNSISLPALVPINLSHDALSERNLQIQSAGVNPAKLKYEHFESGSWWRCSCGGLNVSVSKCNECGIDRDLLANLEDENALLSQGVERKYSQAVEGLSSKTLSIVEKAKLDFESLGNYKDSKDKLSECDDRIASLKAGRSRRTKIEVIVGVVIAVVIVLIVLAVTVFIPSLRINEAMQKAENGEYDEAIGILKEYDAEDQIPDVIRMEAADAVESGEIDEALTLYEEISDNEGVFSCAKKYLETGDYSRAIDLLKPLAESKFDGAQDTLYEAEYGYVLANKDSTDEDTCRYLIELKNIDYKDAADIYSSLYTLSASNGHLTNKPVDLFNNLEYIFTLNGVMPGGLDDRTITISSNVREPITAQVNLYQFDSEFHYRFSELIDGGAHSITITVVDDSTGSVLLEDTASF